MNDALILEALTQMKGLHFGKYRGVVTEVDAESMRIRAQVPAVLGEETSGWCLPCVPYAGPQVGFLMLPEVGSGVWIEFEGGQAAQPIWSGCYWRPGEVPATAVEGVKSIVTRAGCMLMDEDAGSITLVDAHKNTVVLDASGIASDSGAGSVIISPEGVDINHGALEIL